MNKMELDFRSAQVTNQRSLPVAGFDLCGTLETDSEQDIAVISSHCTVSYWSERSGQKILVQQAAPFVVRGPMVQKGRYCRADVQITLDHRVLKAIEKVRQGNGVVHLGLEFEVVASPVIGAGQDRVLGAPDQVPIKVDGQTNRPGFVDVSRDDWLKSLKAMGYNEVEVFELPVYTHPALPGMQKVIDVLRMVEQAMGLGDWPGVMSKTRAAFEAVGTLAAEDDDVKAGFQRLWEGMFPDPRDKDIRAALDGIVDKLAKFQHLGRHMRYPFPDIQRPEALLALRQTLALFEYVGSRMKKPEAKT